MAEFLSDLDVMLCNDDSVWCVKSPLRYKSDIVGLIEVQPDFQMDFASVPKLPIVYELYGNRAHREAVLHDWLYTKNAMPDVTYSQANEVFLEAMKVRGKPIYVRYPMYWAVCAAGWTAFHKRNWEDKLCTLK